jgi:hypothetical protein
MLRGESPEKPVKAPIFPGLYISDSAFAEQNGRDIGKHENA